MSVLLLNASFDAIGVISRRRAIILVVTGKADTIDFDANDMVRSPSLEFPVPLTVRLKNMVKIPFASTVPLNRSTLSARDENKCQVSDCSKAGNTIDHLIPRSRGGLHTWNNVALMCAAHNKAKRDYLLSEIGWALKKRPTIPRGTLQLIAQRIPIHPEWEPYLGKIPAGVRYVT